MTDTDIMPFGIHKGKAMANVPPEYLLWLYENNKCYGAVKDYIAENLETIKTEIAYNLKKQR
jgi:uncharacterized protein (DUF3820 family)